MSTWNLRPATTARAPWPKKRKPAFRSMPAARMLRGSGAFSTKAKSRQESLLYESLERTDRRARKPSGTPRKRRVFSISSPRIPDTSSRASSWALPALHWGKRTTLFWNKLQARTARANVSLCQGRHRLPSLLAEGLSPDWTGESPQSPRARTRIHPHPHCDARLRARESRSRLPRNRARQSRLFLYETRSCRKQHLPSKTYSGRHTVTPTVRYFVDRYPMFFPSALLRLRRS